ncbi:MAG: Prenyltransferase [Acidimicrobiales bacterium]|nr:Prenyltransferase [Acidimicrobiales bacterium]
MPRRALAAAVLASLAISSAAVLPGAPALARTAASPASVDLGKAEAFVLSKQQSDGGFELAGFPLFETPDAIYALAARHQSGATWSTSEARAAVDAQVKGGKNPLSYIDHKVDTEATPVDDKGRVALAARTAKIVALVAGPLGISATDFDPANDSPTPVNLLARIDAVRAQDGTYTMPGQLNGVLYVALADWATGRAVPAPLVAQIKAAQRGDGSWDYSGSTGPTGTDIDTSALALLALRRSGLAPTDAAIAAGIGFLARQHGVATGAWSSFGSPDPNSTAIATMALSALGVDVTTRAWRDAAKPGSTGDAYASPLAWLASQQAADGHITSPNDQFGLSTFATTQSLQALARVRYLAPEREAFVARAAALLTTKWTDGPGVPSPASLALISANLGANPSIAANRGGAVAAALGSEAYRRAAAAELFQRSLARTTDPSGETYWANRLQTITRQEMMAQLIGSPEFFTKAGGTNKAFVARAYQVVFFGRSVDDGGSAYWVGRIESGTPRTSVARALLDSAEYRQKEVGAQYQRLLGRAADSGARTYWGERLRHERIEVLLASLVSSGELYRKVVG